MPKLEWQDISISSHVPGKAPVWLVILLYLLVEDLFCRSSIYFCWLHLQLHLPVLPIKGPFWSPTAHYLRWTVQGWWFIFSSHPRKWPMTIHEVSKVYKTQRVVFIFRWHSTFSTVDIKANRQQTAANSITYRRSSGLSTASERRGLAFFALGVGFPPEKAGCPGLQRYRKEKRVKLLKNLTIQEWWYYNMFVSNIHNLVTNQL